MKKVNRISKWILFLGFCGISIQSFSQLAVVNNGRVGIGVNTVPNTYKMFVDGESHAAAGFSITHTSPWGWAELSLVNTADVKSWIVDYNGSHKFFVKSNGQMYSNGSYLTSDIKLKTDIKPMTTGIQKIQMLKPVSFHLKSDSAEGNGKPKTNFGFIAQDVRKYFPYLTKYAYHDASMTDSTLYVNYDMIIPVLVSAVKEQQQMIDSLKNTLSSLVKNDNTPVVHTPIDHIIIIPNPTTGNVIIKTPEIIAPYKVIVTNLNGQTVYSSDYTTSNCSEFNLNLSHLVKGIYIVNIYDGGQIIDSQKLILE
ncbi:MAG: hypothetical protein ACI9UJ_001744 [bacterium]|jgi:hypothetical protein